jgi:hypothetical protein
MREVRRQDKPKSARPAAQIPKLWLVQFRLWRQGEKLRPGPLRKSARQREFWKKFHAQA